MAESSTGTATAKTGGGSWITRKIGPLPAWGWGVAAVGVYYWYTHYGPGASKQTGTAQQPAGGGLKTYAPRITETITETVPKRGGGARKPPTRKPPRRHHKPKPKPKPPHSRPPHRNAAMAAPAGAAGVNPGGPNRPPGPGVNPGGPDKKPGHRRQPPPPPQPPPAPVPPGPEQVASANYAPSSPPTGGAVNADTGQPVYWEWQHAHRGPEVPMPVQAYAPMTSGSVYDAASAGAAIAAG